jgi:hypothetical protein
MTQLILVDELKEGLYTGKKLQQLGATDIAHGGMPTYISPLFHFFSATASFFPTV